MGLLTLKAILGDVEDCLHLICTEEVLKRVCLFSVIAELYIPIDDEPRSRWPREQYHERAKRAAKEMEEGRVPKQSRNGCK